MNEMDNIKIEMSGICNKCNKAKLKLYDSSFSPSEHKWNINCENKDICMRIKDSMQKEYEVKRKRQFYWKIIGNGRYAQCPNCGMAFQDVYDFDNYDNYCRHCGVKMEGIK